MHVHVVHGVLLQTWCVWVCLQCAISSRTENSPFNPDLTRDNKQIHDAIQMQTYCDLRNDRSLALAREIRSCSVLFNIECPLVHRSCISYTYIVVK